jgi:hypothetical protein
VISGKILVMSQSGKLLKPFYYFLLNAFKVLLVKKNMTGLIGLKGGASSKISLGEKKIDKPQFLITFYPILPQMSSSFVRC